MVKPLLEPGSTLDGFRLEECLHHGGMATLWRVSREDTSMPMLMKVPRIAEGEEAASVQLRDGAVDPAEADRSSRSEIRRGR